MHACDRRSCCERANPSRSLPFTRRRQGTKKKNAFVGNVCVPSKFTWALLWVVMVSIPGKGVYKHADTLKYSESKMIEPST